MFRTITMKKFASFLLFGAILSNAMGNAVLAQSAEADVISIDSLSCADLLRADGDARSDLLVFMHGYVSGKRGEMSIDGPQLADVTDAIIEACIDSPKHSLLSMFEDQRSGMQWDVNDSFEQGLNGWESGFADLPGEGDISHFELDSERRELPNGLKGHGIYIQGQNRSDDLFMYLTKKVTGLAPNVKYNLRYQIDLATNVPPGLLGIGGSPDQSVFVKVGAAEEKPLAVKAEDGYLRLNIDKGNQSQGGNAMVVVGNLANERVGDDGKFAPKTISTEEIRFQATSNAQGELWLIVGTDSGFEGLTQLYWDRIRVALRAAVE